MDIKIDQKILTDEEKLQLRKQRFNSGANINTIECIKVKKFVFNFNIQLVEEEKRKILERQKKFGVIVQLPEIEEEKIKIRKERFGIVDGKVIKIFYMFFQDEDEKLKKRAERFNIASESDILKKRAERFNIDQSITNTEKPIQKRNRITRRKNKKLKNWKRIGKVNQSNQRDRRGPKRALGFKKFGIRNRLRKRRNLKNKGIRDN